MFKKLTAAFIISTAAINIAHAGCLGCGDAIIGPNDEFPIIWTKVITLSGGPGWASAGETQQQSSTSTDFNLYRANKKSNALGEGELFFSLQHWLYNSITGRFGIAAAGSAPAKLQGDVYLNSDPNARAYTYSYSISHGRIALKGMLLFGQKELLFQPYVMGSIGLGINTSHQYKQTPTSTIYPVVPTFQSNTQNIALAYTLGGGIETAFTRNWHAGLGYQFADWGKSNLDPVRGQTYKEGLRLTNLYTQLLQFSITYVC